MNDQFILNGALWLLAAQYVLQSTSALVQGIMYLMSATSSCQIWPVVRNGNWTSDLSQTVFLGQLVALCLFTPVYVSHVCILHKSVLSPPSWSYQSVAELRGVFKGHPHHRRQHPYCRLPTVLFALTLQLLTLLLLQCWIFSVFSVVKRLLWGQRSMSQFRSYSDICSSLFQSLITKQRRRASQTDREEGIAQNVLNFLIISFAAYALM